MNGTHLSDSDQEQQRIGPIGTLVLLSAWAPVGVLVAMILLQR